ncbi:MAG: hypothetical protein ACRDNS_22950, partial [Trebonia sp.]
VQSSATVASSPALHTIRLRQFSPRVSGSLGAARRLAVEVELSRAHMVVAVAHGRTRANGSWGLLTLRGRDGHPHAVGDDRDVITVRYGSSRPTPAPDLIETGDGGNPFTESGWTGWFDLDHGYAVHSSGDRSYLLIGPCSQTGVLSLRIGSTLSAAPTQLCETESDAAVVAVRRFGSGTALALDSEDNRGVYQREPDGALVQLTVPLGEPDSVPAVPNGQLPYRPTGFPTCSALLRIRTVRCSGLVAHARYRLVRRAKRLGAGQAGAAGVVRFDRLSIRGGVVLTLVNAAGRRLTSLHVARLRVSIVGEQTRIASGSCQPGEYWGRPPSTPPISGEIGQGIAGSGTICPESGRAGGLPARQISQTDEFSGGQTATQVPLVESTAPIQDETLYGAFVASAQSGLPGPHGSVSATGVPIALTIFAAGSRRRVFHADDVDTPRGVSVPALAPGGYVARWVLHDAAGDTRTVTTRFVDQP